MLLSQAAFIRAPAFLPRSGFSGAAALTALGTGKGAARQGLGSWASWHRVWEVGRLLFLHHPSTVRSVPAPLR